MKVSGFTFIRNAIRYDYPVVEAIRSILPICDRFVVAVGKSEDDTLDLVRSIASPKLQIIETVWDDTLTEGGQVLAKETDKAFAAIDEDTDWCFYIQGDEVVHEKYLPAIRAAMQKYKNSPEVDGLLFNYLHFYGSYDYVGASTRWYRNEIRIVRNDKSIYAYRDAQGFRKADNEKLRVKALDASVYHYGWVRKPDIMQRKSANFGALYHGQAWKEKQLAQAKFFDYSEIDALKKFTDTHPEVMQARIESINWAFDYDIAKNKFSLKHKFKTFVEKLTGHRPFEYKNYKLV